MYEKTIQFISAVICGILSYMYGEFDGMLKALVFCMAIDYITGLIVAYKNRELSSKIGFLGLAKKFVMLLIVALGHIIDVEIFSNAMFMKSAVCGFYIANEGLSILENTAAVGVKYPEKLLKALKQVNSDTEDKKDEKEDMH
ncbi:MAG: holin family protein [Oscillospiraceae bacterium]